MTTPRRAVAGQSPQSASPAVCGEALRETGQAGRYLNIICERPLTQRQICKPLTGTIQLFNAGVNHPGDFVSVAAQDCEHRRAPDSDGHGGAKRLCIPPTMVSMHRTTRSRSLARARAKNTQSTYSDVRQRRRTDPGPVLNCPAEGRSTARQRVARPGNRRAAPRPGPERPSGTATPRAGCWVQKLEWTRAARSISDARAQRGTIAVA